MAMLPSIRVDIASSFNDKGFKKAARSTNILTKQFKQLGTTVLAAMSVRAILRFSQTAIKEFAADQDAAMKLAKTFENLGMSFEGAIANDYINKLQFTSRVADDELRPALSQLIRTTLDFNKAQEILNTALDVAAGTGMSVEQVTSALSKAYLGNTTALGRMNIGIGKAEAKTITFDKAMERLNTRFGGQAAIAADTYAGKLKLLSIASEEARESIGQRLVLALELLSKDQTIEGLADDMQTFADKIGLAAVGLGKLLGTLNRKIEIGGRTLGEILFAAAGGGFIDALAKIGGEAEYISGKKRTLGAPGAMQQAKRDAAERKRLLAEQKKMIEFEKKAAAEKAKREKLAAAQRRANTIFDIENIQIVAALQGKIDGEERLRLTALLALQTQNYLAAEKLADLVIRLQAPALNNLGVIMQAGDSIDKMIIGLITSQAKLAGLQLMAEDFPIPEDIFQEWEDSLDEVLKKLLEMLELMDKISKKKTGFYALDALGFSSLESYQNYRQGERASIMNGSAVGSGTTATNTSFLPSITNNGGATIVVNVAGNVTSERDLVSVITDQIYLQQKSGKQITYSSQTI